MTKQPSALNELIEALKILPGVGPKTAQRMAYFLMQHQRQGAVRLSEALSYAVSHLKHCQRCNTFTEHDVCELCLDTRRDPSLLCVVEMPTDQNMLEQTLAYRGYYFVLMGRLSPLDGIGPKEIHFDRLMQRASDADVKEVILATNFTNEGEATAHYLSEKLKSRNVTVTRLARGVPVGGELEYVDPGTIARAMLDRRAL